MDPRVALLLGAIILHRTPDANDANDKGQAGRGQVLPDIPDEIGHHCAVLVVATRLVPFGVGPAVDHVIPALEPNKARQFIALLGIVARNHPANVGEHFLHVIHHESVIKAGRCGLLGLDRRDILALLPEGLELGLVELVGSRAGRTEIGVEAFASPCGLDDQNRLVEEFLQIEAEGEFGTDLGTPLFRAKASRQQAGFLLL